MKTEHHSPHEDFGRLANGIYSFSVRGIRWMIQPKEKNFREEETMKTSIAPPIPLFILVVLTTALLQGCGTHPVPMGTDQIKTIHNVDQSGVGISGYDPVAFFTEGKPVKGNPQYQSKASNYGGATYYFASAEHKVLFDQNPEKYTPQYGGYCATAMSMGKLAEIQVDHFVIHNDRLLMQHNRMARTIFMQNPDERLAAADKNWPGMLVQPVRSKQE